MTQFDLIIASFCCSWFLVVIFCRLTSALTILITFTGKYWVRPMAGSWTEVIELDETVYIEFKILVLLTWGPCIVKWLFHLDKWTISAPISVEKLLKTMNHNQLNKPPWLSNWSRKLQSLLLCTLLRSLTVMCRTYWLDQIVLLTWEIIFLAFNRVACRSWCEYKFPEQLVKTSQAWCNESWCYSSTLITIITVQSFVWRVNSWPFRPAREFEVWWKLFVVDTWQASIIDKVLLL